jgi:hypothetical protein
MGDFMRIGELSPRDLQDLLERDAGCGEVTASPSRGAAIRRSMPVSYVRTTQATLYSSLPVRICRVMPAWRGRVVAQ